MKILSIETSCDETAVSLVEASGNLNDATFTVLGDALLSQAKLHAEYGGVYPSLAKREHAKNLIPLLTQVLLEAKLEKAAGKSDTLTSTHHHDELKTILEREPELLTQFEKFITTTEAPPVDAIAVTYGPGLEPALWVGINFAKALSLVWNIPLIPVNHMEGHILSAMLVNMKYEIINSKQIRNNKYEIRNVEFPVLALLISGAHTELVLMNDWGKYEVLGETRDDAVGEAFDKVARMLGLPYPGGPEISKLAEKARKQGLLGSSTPKSAVARSIEFPRPMIGSSNFDFSFSGLKTAVLYFIKNQLGSSTPKLGDAQKQEIAKAFEDAVVDVLLSKTKQALEKYGVKTLVIGGGVSANKEIRRAFTELAEEKSGTTLFIPNAGLTTDNAIMIAIAGYYTSKQKGYVLGEERSITAEGHLTL